MDAHEVLVRARNLIDNVGWTQGVFYLTTDGTTPMGYCAHGALQYPTCRLVERCYDRPTWDALDTLIDELGVGSESGLQVWNDTPGRTKQEVLDLFDRAIASTAPAPSFESLGQEPATEREPVIEVLA